MEIFGQIMNILLTAINSAIKASNKEDMLKKHCGKAFIMTIAQSVVKISATVDHDGYLADYVPDGDVDNDTTRINIKFSSVINHLINQDKLATIKTIDITGDKDFAFTLLEVFSALDFGSAEYFTNPVLNVCMSYMQKLVTALSSYIKNIVNDLTSASVDYMVYQRGDIVGRVELEEFYDQVDAVARRFDKLYAAFMANRV